MVLGTVLLLVVMEAGPMVWPASVGQVVLHAVARSLQLEARRTVVATLVMMEMEMVLTEVPSFTGVMLYYLVEKGMVALEAGATTEGVAHITLAVGEDPVTPTTPSLRPLTALGPAMATLGSPL